MNLFKLYQSIMVFIIKIRSLFVFEKKILKYNNLHEKKHLNHLHLRK